VAKKLPRPDSKELKSLGFSTFERQIYGVLYENRGTPMTMPEFRKILNVAAGNQEHLNRRMRELYREFEIERKREGRVTTYELIGRLDQPRLKSDISKTDRAYVLRNQRCEQCGRTPREHRVVLHVDHKIPREWGGTNERDNLQALCSDCNEGKKNYYATYDKYADQIKQAINYDEPQRRIGEVLKAFKGAPVRGDLLERVASAKAYQEDWQKRLRELRTLGWKIKPTKKKEQGRIVAYYQLEHAEPWPKGNVAAEIRRLERKKKKK
jgi:5-methylcytosine-specific restriction endonuclease McrA